LSSISGLGQSLLRKQRPYVLGSCAGLRLMMHGVVAAPKQTESIHMMHVGTFSFGQTAPAVHATSHVVVVVTPLL